MTRPTLKTVKRLFALSNNRCAFPFPQCDRKIVQPDETITGEICHIAAKSKQGPRYDPNLSAKEKHSFENLILLCAHHHKIIDGDANTYTIEWLRRAKVAHESRGNADLSPEGVRHARQLFKSHQSIQAKDKAKVMINSPGGIQGENITVITGRKHPSQIPHPESIAADLNKRNYVKYLIERYKRFQHADKEKIGAGKYIIIYNAIKTEFGAKWDDIRCVYFEQLTAYLQHRILKSKLGRIRYAQGNKCFSSYEEWLKKPEKA